MEHYEMRLLADYTHTGVQAANTPAKPSPRTVLGELERDERAEVVYAEVVQSPVDGGAEEPLRKITLVLDTQKVDPYVSLSGTLSSVMTPPKRSIWGGKLYSFGTPMSSNPLLSTTLKYSESVTFECLAGASAITGDYRVRLWGYVYKVDELTAVFGTMVFPAQMIDRARHRTLSLDKIFRLPNGQEIHGIPVNGDTWKTLPGGKDQSIPKINPFIRFAYNLVATDGKSGDYQFRYETGNVADSEENMFFEFSDLDALLIVGLGIRADAPGHLAHTGLLIAGDYHPKGLMPTTYADNPLHFGQVYPFIHTAAGMPAEIPFFYAIPKLEKPYLIWKEKGMVVARDDGTAVAINDLIVCITGIRVEMKG